MYGSRCTSLVNYSFVTADSLAESAEAGEKTNEAREKFSEPVHLHSPDSPISISPLHGDDKVSGITIDIQLVISVYVIGLSSSGTYSLSMLVKVKSSVIVAELLLCLCT